MPERNEEFDEMLDDLYPTVTVGGLTFLASNVLYNCDPTAYRCYLADWDNSE